MKSFFHHPRILIVCLPILLFFILLWNYLGLSGVRHVSWGGLHDQSPFIQSLLPDDRVERVVTSGGPATKLTGEPVYFSVFAPPGNWETAEIFVRASPEVRSVLELGALKDLFAQAYDFRPVANTVLQHLEKTGWVKRQFMKGDENRAVYYKSVAYADNPRLLQNGDIATYRTSLPWAPPAPRTLKTREHEYAVPLRGPVEFFTFIHERETLKFGATFRDENMAPGTDEGTLRVYAESGEIVASSTFADDGNVTNDLKPSEAREVFVEGDGLPSGVYRIVLSGTSDVVWESIRTAQEYLVIKNSFTLAEHSGKVLFTTDAKKVTVEPLAADGLTQVDFGEEHALLDTVRLKVPLVSPEGGVQSLTISSGSLKIVGEGKFSFTPSSFFNPEPAGFTNFLLAPEEFNALIAAVPQESVTFELATLAKERGAYKFALSAPLINETDGGVLIWDISITFRKDPLTFRSFLSSLKRFAYEIF